MRAETSLARLNVLDELGPVVDVELAVDVAGVIPHFLFGDGKRCHCHVRGVLIPECRDERDQTTGDCQSPTILLELLCLSCLAEPANPTQIRP